GRAQIVKESGLVIASSYGASLADRAQSVEYAAVKDHGARARGHGSGYLRASFPGEGDWIIGYADTGLSGEHRNIDWSVVTSTKASAALATTSGTQFLIMGIALVSLACIVMFWVYLSLHVRSEIEEIDDEMRQVRDGAV